MIEISLINVCFRCQLSHHPFTDRHTHTLNNPLAIIYEYMYAPPFIGNERKRSAPSATIERALVVGWTDVRNFFDHLKS